MIEIQNKVRNHQGGIRDKEGILRLLSDVLNAARQTVTHITDQTAGKVEVFGKIHLLQISRQTAVAFLYRFKKSEGTGNVFSRLFRSVCQEQFRPSIVDCHNRLRLES